MLSAQFNKISYSVFVYGLYYFIISYPNLLASSLLVSCKIAMLFAETLCDSIATGELYQVFLQILTDLLFPNGSHGYEIETDFWAVQNFKR